MIGDAIEVMAETIWDLDRGSRGPEYSNCREGTKRHLRREAAALMESAGSPAVCFVCGEEATRKALASRNGVTRFYCHETNPSCYTQSVGHFFDDLK